MEVVEEGESSSRPAKRKEEGRRGPGRPSAPPTAIAIGSRMDGILFASTINKPHARRPAHCWGLALAADCPVGLVLLIGIAHHGINHQPLCYLCCDCDACCQPNRLCSWYRTACNATRCWSGRWCSGATPPTVREAVRSGQDRLDRQALRASAFPTMDPGYSLHTSAPVPQPSQS